MNRRSSMGEITSSASCRMKPANWMPASCWKRSSASMMLFRQSALLVGPGRAQTTLCTLG
ncbi:hypothetical protein D3C71_2135990 [compost metagenome]